MKTLTTVLFLLLGGLNFCYAQGCNPTTSILTTQGQIDSFPILYPDCEEITSFLRIRGEGINNLNGLSQLKRVQLHLVIEETNLSDLSGLEGLEEVKELQILKNDNLVDLSALSNLTKLGYSLYISENNQLSTLFGLHNIDFNAISSSGWIEIDNCPNLVGCEIDNFCQHLLNYRYIFVHDNGPGCEYLEDIFSSCMLNLEDEARVEIFYDGFENWGGDGISGMPTGWWGDYGSGYDDQLSIEKVPALNEGDFAVAIRVVLPGFEGPRKTWLRKELPDNKSLIDISFSFQCKGKGYCYIMLREQSADGPGAHERIVWIREAGLDSLTHSVVLPNIEVNAPFVTFASVDFVARPITYPTGTSGNAEFIIDSLAVTQKESLVHTEHTPSSFDVKLFPNPANDQLHIASPTRFDQIFIYDSLGSLKAQFDYESTINTGNLPTGVYTLTLQKGSERVSEKVVITQ